LDAMGSSGQIIILASGSDTSVNVGGTVQAQQAEVDIRQTGVAGQTTLNNATVHGDVVKISALGTNGALNIGSGNVLGADTILKLYATGSNGTLNFLSNVTLTSPSNILAANTINISQGVIVTINSVQPADVFTNNPNYFVFEGTAVQTGTDSRAELTFLDQTLTWLGGNTVFSFGAAVRTYDLGSGAILISAPKETGTVKVTTAVAICAVSGFTAVLERHSNAWNKFILLHGNGTLTLKGIPGGPCRLQTGQMVVFPPHPTRCPPVLNIDISKLL